MVDVKGYVTVSTNRYSVPVDWIGRRVEVREYPREPLLAAVAEAARYGLYDLDRVERMVLRKVACDYFLLNNDPESNRRNQATNWSSC